MSDEASLSFEGALRGLVAEIAVGDYQDPLRQRLTLNTAYIEAAALLELTDTLAAGTGAAGAGYHA